MACPSPEEAVVDSGTPSMDMGMPPADDVGTDVGPGDASRLGVDAFDAPTTTDTGTIEVDTGTIGIDTGTIATDTGTIATDTGFDARLIATDTGFDAPTRDAFSLACGPGTLPSGGVCKPTCTSALQCTAVNETCDVMGGVCACRPATHSCGGVCSSDVSVASCGTRCTPCPTAALATTECLAGECTLICMSGTTLCGGTCAMCPAAPGVASTACAGTACVVATCAAGFTLTAGVCVATPARWTSVVVDAATSGINRGSSVSLALDASGNPHVAYPGVLEHTRYARFDGVGWVLEGVGGTRPIALSLALSPTGSPHIAYRARSGITEFAGYLHRSGGTWRSEGVTADDVLFGPTIALDASGSAHMAFRTAAGNLIVAVHNGVGVTQRTVTTNGQTSAGLAADSMGRIRIAFSRAPPFELGYGVFGAAWSNSIVLPAPTYVYNPRLAFDASDVAHILTLRSTSELLHLVQTPTGWTPSTVDMIDRDTVAAIAIDSSGFAHVAYVESIQRDLKYGTFDGTSWQLTTLATALTDHAAVSIAVDGLRRPRIAYSSGGSLHYMWFE